MAIAEDDGGEMIVGDVTHSGGRALAVGVSATAGADGASHVSIGWVEQGERLELTIREATALRDELTRILGDLEEHKGHEER